jgi:AcrR family transcriptional regulator
VVIPAKGARPKGPRGAPKPHARPKKASTKRAGSGEPRLRLDVDERRAQLVELGLEHFGTHAYDDVSIDEIAASAGISKGLLYHYFPTKRAFYAATIREAAARLVASTETDDSAPPLVALHAALDAYLTYVRAHARAYATLMRSGVGVDPAIAQIVDETRARFVAQLIDGYAKGQLPSAEASARRALESPLVTVALRGWVGFTEAASLGWTEALDAGSPAPSQEEVRTLLANALVEILRTAAR